MMRQDQCADKVEDNYSADDLQRARLKRKCSQGLSKVRRLRAVLTLQFESGQHVPPFFQTMETGSAGR